MSQPIVPSITDEQLAELEAFTSDFYPVDKLITTHGEMQSVLNRLRAAEKDAARYRWLRGKVGVDHAYGDFMAFLPCGNYEITEHDNHNTDQAIDAAIEQNQ